MGGYVQVGLSCFVHVWLQLLVAKHPVHSVSGSSKYTSSSLERLSEPAEDAKPLKSRLSYRKDCKVCMNPLHLVQASRV